MEERRKGAIILLLIFGIMLSICGLYGLFNRTSYNSPIYLSQDSKIVDNTSGSKTIYVQLRNRTNESVEISQINFYLEGDGVYSNMPYCYHVIIESDGTYDLEIKGIKKIFNKCSVKSCQIGETFYPLKYSADGVYFDDNSSSLTINMLLAIGGITFLIIAAGLVVGYIRKKNTIKY